MLLGGFLGLLTLTGCGSEEEGEYPDRLRASATVTYQGQPVQDAHVTFAPLMPGGKPAFGDTDADGFVKLASFGFKDGAVAGEYVVMVSKTQSPTSTTTGGTAGRAAPFGRSKRAKPVDMLPARYKARKTSNLLAKVLPGNKNDFTFELLD